MKGHITKRSKKSGLPPGTLVHIGEKKADASRITVLDYNEANFQEAEFSTIEARRYSLSSPALATHGSN